MQAKVIAKRQAIPFRFVEQILSALKQAGIVTSLRGAQGGYSLTKEPDQTSLAEIVQAMKGGTSLFSPSSNGLSEGYLETRRNHEALLSGIWENIQSAELEILRSISLETLVEQYQQLAEERTLMYHI
jgi:Rrf2 family protein